MKYNSHYIDYIKDLYSSIKKLLSFLMTVLIIIRKNYLSNFWGLFFEWIKNSFRINKMNLRNIDWKIYSYPEWQKKKNVILSDSEESRKFILTNPPPLRGPLLKSPRLKPYPLYQGENRRKFFSPLDKEGLGEICL